MNSPRSQFPLWLFIATDLALIGAAAVIAAQAPQPFSQATIIWIVSCIVLGVLVGLVPIIWHFERKKNEALDDRQRALEALARTVSSSAEQISIATGGLHEIAEVAQKNLRQADQLPHRLQEKIAEFQAQLAQANDTEKEELERELLALRTSETERLEAVSQRIAKTSADWVKLESATAQHLAGVNEGLTRLAKGTADNISKVHAAAEQALNQSRIEAARSLSEASTQAVKAIEAARTAALNELSGQLAVLLAQVAHDAATQLSARLASSTADLEAQLTRLEANRTALAAATSTPPTASVPKAETSASSVDPISPPSTEPVAAPAEAMPAAISADPSAPIVAGAGPENLRTPETAAESAPAALVGKRPRKPRREEAPVASVSAPEPTNGIADQTASALPARPADETAGTPRRASIPVEAAPPTPAATTDSVVAPPPAAVSAPHSVESPGSTPSDTSGEPPAAATETPAPTTAPAPEPVTPAAAASSPPAFAPDTEDLKAAGPRKRPAKKSAEDDLLSLDLGLDDGDFGEGTRGGGRGITDRVLSSDGATRLIVTAYIGIGNRVFIRGDGPGLSWERGVPLEFVSIGKWRWQTSDATQPVQFKIYKNDELECPSLGKQVIDPGYQQEVTAGF